MITLNITDVREGVVLNPRDIKKALSENATIKPLLKTVVNFPFADRRHATELGLGIVVLLIADKDNNTLNRIALSDTEMADGAVQISAKPFRDIKIPLDVAENLLIAAMNDSVYKQTQDWHDIFLPVLTADEARLNQAGAAIACSVVYPLLHKRTAFGAMIFSYFVPLEDITREHHDFMKKYASEISKHLANIESSELLAA